MTTSNEDLKKELDSARVTVLALTTKLDAQAKLVEQLLGKVSELEAKAVTAQTGTEHSLAPSLLLHEGYTHYKMWHTWCKPDGGFALRRAAIESALVEAKVAVTARRSIMDQFAFTVLPYLTEPPPSSATLTSWKAFRDVISLEIEKATELAKKTPDYVNVARRHLGGSGMEPGLRVSLAVARGSVLKNAVNPAPPGHGDDGK